MSEEQIIREITEPFRTSRKLLTIAIVINIVAILMDIDIITDGADSIVLTRIYQVGLIILVINLSQLRLRYKETKQDERKSLEFHGFYNYKK